MSDYFSLSDCDVIGFDLDHTLCRYRLKEISRLIYESFARFLVEHKGYDKDLLNLTPDTWDFCFKGLVVDLEDGNLMKLAEDGTVLRASHGTNDLSIDEITKHYGLKREWKHFNSLNTSFTRSAKYYFYDNYFDLPGVLLCGKVVDMLHKQGNAVNCDFWKDMLAAIEHNYNTSAFKDGDVRTSSQTYEAIAGLQHQDLRACDSRLHINCSWPDLRSSPDTLLSCTCCGSGVLKIKCPHCAKDAGVLGASVKKHFCI